MSQEHNLNDLQSVADMSQAEALAEKLRPTNDGMWRSICRSFSQKFSTPLKEVLSMDPEFIFQHHYESELEDVDTEENFDEIQRMIRMIKDPAYVQEEEEELEDFIEEMERQESERIKARKPIHPGMKAEGGLPETKLPEPAKLSTEPKQGFVDFSKLNQSEES